MAEKNLNLLSIGINRAEDIAYTQNELFATAHLFYTKYGTFDVRLNRAIQDFDIDEMRALLDESEKEGYENKRNDPKIGYSNQEFVVQHKRRKIVTIAVERRREPKGPNESVPNHSEIEAFVLRKESRQI